MKPVDTPASAAMTRMLAPLMPCSATVRAPASTMRSRASGSRGGLPIPKRTLRNDRYECKGGDGRGLRPGADASEVGGDCLGGQAWFVCAAGGNRLDGG